LSAYGASKLAGEEAVRAAGGAHLIIRTSWVYGATGANFLRSIARLARERRELRIVADQFGAPTSARLIAAAVAGIIGKGRAKGGAPLAERFAASGGLVNVAACGVTSWHGFAAAIVEGLKRRGVALAAENVVPIRTEDYPTKARRPANSRFDLARLSRVFGIETPPWDAALATELDRLADELANSPR
jgi:dTDP-4-dehydrorhamnose reductase